MMPEEPCDGKRPPRSRGDSPWEKSGSAKRGKEGGAHSTLNLSYGGNAFESMEEEGRNLCNALQVTTNS